MANSTRVSFVCFFTNEEFPKMNKIQLKQMSSNWRVGSDYEYCPNELTEKK